MKSIKSYSGSVVGAIITCLILLHPPALHAQLGNVSSILQAGKEDATLLVQEYLSPLSSGLGAGLNSGWNESAGARHTLGFSVQLRGAMVTVPTEAQSFDVNELALTEIQLDENATTSISPTISGDNTEGAMLEIEEQIDGNTYELVNFNMPQGTGFHYVPTPMIQGNVGLPKNIEIMGRIIPEFPLKAPGMDEEFGKFKMFGLGAKHEINDYIPGGNILPVTLSLMAGFNNIEMSSNLDMKKEPDANTATDPDYTGNYDDQMITAKANSFTVNILAGKDLPIISVYGGIGFETSTTDISASGSYPIIVPNEEYPRNSSKPKRIDTITDPVSFSQKGANNVHALVGGSVSLLIFDFMVEATLAKYSTVNAGIGIGL